MSKIYSVMQSFKYYILYVLVIISVLVHIGLFSWYYFGHEYEIKKYSLIDVSRHLIPQRHFLTTIQPLREQIREYVAHNVPNSVVYIEFLNTGANININQEYRVWPASLAKLPIGLAVMKVVEDGIWSLDDMFEIKQEFRYADSPILDQHGPGAKVSIRDLLSALLARSDNTAYATLLLNLPKAYVDGIEDALGLRALFDKEGRISAKEYSRIMVSLYTASYLKREHSQYLLELLDQSTFNAFLQQGIPEAVPFPHKFSMNTELHTYGDSGIVYVPNRPYLITVVIKGDGESPNELETVKEAMRFISKASYDFFSKE